MKQEVLNLVEDLNIELECRGGLDYYFPFEFKSYGWNNSAIFFMGVVLWTEDNDEREYLTESDQKEPLRTYIIREAEKILKDLNLKMGAF